MSQFPLVSVVMPTRNRLQTLRRTVRALLEDNYPRVEIIVCDGASTDGTREFLSSLGDRITRWVSEPDTGEYDALNKGIRMANGEIVKLMTDDDVLRPDAIRLGVDYLARNPEVGIVFGQTAFWRDAAGKEEFLWRTAVADPGRLTVRHWIRQSTGLQSISAFIRRSVFDQIGQFSLDYVCGDVEFWARAASQGVKMGLIPEVVLDYHWTGENGAVRRVWRISRDMVKINRQHGGKGDVLLAIWRGFFLQAAATISRSVGFRPLLSWRRYRSGRVA